MTTSLARGDGQADRNRNTQNDNANRRGIDRTVMLRVLRALNAICPLPASGFWAADDTELSGLDPSDRPGVSVETSDSSCTAALAFCAYSSPACSGCSGIGDGCFCCRSPSGSRLRLWPMGEFVSTLTAISRPASVALDLGCVWGCELSLDVPVTWS